MKMNVIILLSFFAMLGCEQNNDVNIYIDKKDLIGNWVNTIEEKDTLFFNDTIIIRLDSATLLPIDKYSYSLFEDSIKIKYIGHLYIDVLETTHKILLDRENMILTIENFSNYFPGYYDGNKFKKITTKN